MITDHVSWWQALSELLGWALLHSLWQLAALGLLMFVALFLLRKRSARVRYIVSCLGLVVMALAPIVTVCYIGATESKRVVSNQSPNKSENSTPILPDTANIEGGNTTNQEYTRIGSTNQPQSDVPLDEGGGITGIDDDVNHHASHLVPTIQEIWSALYAHSIRWTTVLPPWITMCWGVGVLAYAIHNLQGLRAVSRLRHRQVVKVEARVAKRFEQLLQQLRMRHHVELLQSPHLDSPVVIGWVRPVILLPLGLVSGLSPAHLDAILMHELAHVRRHDYLANLLQVVIETFYFFHPAVWWLSQRVRLEREYCCDDLAVATCGSHLNFVKALTAVEVSRANPSFALAAIDHSQEKTTMKRIRRLLNESSVELTPNARMVATVLATVPVLLLTACLVWANKPEVGRNDVAPEKNTVNESPAKTKNKKSSTSPDATISRNRTVVTTPVKIADQQGLALYYSFDDDSNDVVLDGSGNERNARTVGNVKYETSFLGKAARISSNKTYILTDQLNMNQWRVLSVSAWIKTNRVTAHAQVLSCGEVTGDEMSGFTMQVGGTSKAAWCVSTEYQGRARQGQRVYTSSLLPLKMKRVGKWVHLTGVFDGTSVKFYINGKLDSQNEAANLAPYIWQPKTHKLVIGNTAAKSRMSWVDKYFDGLIDEVRVWKRALTADEIAIRYEEDLAIVREFEYRQKLGSKMIDRGPLAKDLVVHYSFDDDSDGKVYDVSGNGNHAETVGKVDYLPSFCGMAPKFSNYRTYIVSDAPGLNMYGWRQISVSTWIKTVRPTTYANIISRGEVTGDSVGGISLRAGSSACKGSFTFLRQYSNNPPVPEKLYSSTLQPRNIDRIGKWVHLAGTFDGKFIRLYVDGKLDREVEASSDGLKVWDRPDHRLVIGTAATKSRMAWLDKYFDGQIDEVKIWKRSLTSSEVETIFADSAKRIDDAGDKRIRKDKPVFNPSYNYSIF